MRALDSAYSREEVDEHREEAERHLEDAVERHGHEQADGRELVVEVVAVHREVNEERARRQHERHHHEQHHYCARLRYSTVRIYAYLIFCYKVYLGSDVFYGSQIRIRE